MITKKENSKLHKIIDKFYETIDRFIHWICVKFDIAEEYNLIRNFQRETNTLLDPEKQMKHEGMEKNRIQNNKNRQGMIPCLSHKNKMSCHL